MLVDKVALNTLRRSSEADGELLLVFRDLPNRLRIIADNGEPGIVPPHTTQHEMYFINYDGPGRHVKVIPEGMQATDRLTYQLSTRFGSGRAGDWRSAFQEAPYSTLDPMPFPIRIDAGNRASIFDGAAIDAWGHTDWTDEKGQRWWLDHPYMSSPPNLGLPRYGYSGATAPGTFFGEPTVQSHPSRTTPLVMSARCGTPFFGLRYHIDVPNGRYRVTLGFQETWLCPKPMSAGPGGGPRLFDVEAEGTTVLNRLNVYGEAGANVLWKTFDVEVADGQLTLDFVNGYGFVSAIQVDRASP
jgi:hypothetical protein